MDHFRQHELLFDRRLRIRLWFTNDDNTICGYHGKYHGNRNTNQYFVTEFHDSTTCGCKFYQIYFVFYRIPGRWFVQYQSYIVRICCQCAVTFGIFVHIQYVYRTLRFVQSAIYHYPIRYLQCTICIFTIHCVQFHHRHHQCANIIYYILWNRIQCD